MTRRKVFRLIFFLVALIGLLFLIQDKLKKHTKTTTSTVDWHDIVKRGELRAVVGKNTFSYFFYKGRPIGFEYEVLKKIADDWHVRLRVLPVYSMKDAVEMLDKGYADMLAIPMTVQANNEENFS